MPLPASRLARVVAVLLAIAAGVDAAEPLPPARAPDTPEAWRTPVAPFRIADRTSCDVLITPHPDASGWRLQDPAQSRPITCAAYAQAAEERLERQLAEQRSAEAR